MVSTGHHQLAVGEGAGTGTAARILEPPQPLLGDRVDLQRRRLGRLRAADRQRAGRGLLVVGGRERRQALDPDLSRGVGGQPVGAGRLDLARVVGLDHAVDEDRERQHAEHADHRAQGAAPGREPGGLDPAALAEADHRGQQGQVDDQDDRDRDHDHHHVAGVDRLRVGRVGLRRRQVDRVGRGRGPCEREHGGGGGEQDGPTAQGGAILIVKRRSTAARRDRGREAALARPRRAQLQAAIESDSRLPSEFGARPLDRRRAAPIDEGRRARR